MTLDSVAKNVLDGVAKNVARLIAENRRLRAEVDRLAASRERLAAENRGLSTEIAGLERRLTIKELSDGFAAETVDRRGAKIARARVNRLLRDVDKCIALLRAE